MFTSQLLITFTDSKNLDKIVESIKSSYTILFDKIFILQSVNENNKLICSYNIDSSKEIKVETIPINTISVHRKKISNTLYTINALNHLITLLNDGILDKKFLVDWNNYSNSILVIDNNEFKKINTKLLKIVEL